MNRLILLSIFICLAFGVDAQRMSFKDANFTFNPGFCSEREWMVMPKVDTTEDYCFGYTYIDKSTMSFVFQQVGTFKVNQKHNYILNEASLSINYPHSVMHEYKILRGSLQLWPMANIAGKHFAELQIKGEPDWVKQYYNYTDTLDHNYLWGSIYADAGYPTKALAYFKNVQKVNPHYKDMELTMAFLYSRMGKTKEAIKFLDNCIANAPDNLLFYVALSQAYQLEGKWQTSIDVCKRGLTYATAGKSEPKAMLALNISNSFIHLKDQNSADAWREKARDFDTVADRGTP